MVQYNCSKRLFWFETEENKMYVTDIFFVKELLNGNRNCKMV